MSRERGLTYRLFIAARAAIVLGLAVYGAVDLLEGAVFEDPVAVWERCNRDADAGNPGCLEIELTAGGKTVNEPECWRTTNDSEVDLLCLPRRTLALTPRQRVDAFVPAGATKLRITFFKGAYDGVRASGIRSAGYSVTADERPDVSMKRGSRHFAFIAPSTTGPSRYAQITLWNGSSNRARFAFRYQVR